MALSRIAVLRKSGASFDDLAAPRYPWCWRLSDENLLVVRFGRPLRGIVAHVNPRALPAEFCASNGELLMFGFDGENPALTLENHS